MLEKIGILLPYLAWNNSHVAIFLQDKRERVAIYAEFLVLNRGRVHSDEAAS